MTVRSDTQTIRLGATVRAAFDFIADPANLPAWAVGFCRSIRRDGDRWIVNTGSGECPIVVDADARRGTVDFHMTPAPGVAVTAFTRIVECEDGCEYVFTQFSAPGMPDAAFDANVEAVKEELLVLRSIIRARHVCPAGGAR